jgi:hypothetical protein
MHSAWFSFDVRGSGGHWDRAENRVKASSLTTDNGVIVNEPLRTKENAMGRLARRKTARKSEPYDHLPFFYSDMFDLGYERSAKSIRISKHSPTGSSRVRSVLLWNVWEQVEAARKLIASAGPFYSENLKGRLPA